MLPLSVGCLLGCCLSLTVLAAAKYLPVQVNETEEAAMTIPRVLAPRNLTPLANAYGFVNVCQSTECGDYHIVGYYLSQHSASFMIRRLDGLNWSYDLSIFVSHERGVVKQREIFHIGPSASSYKHFIANTSLPLSRDHSVRSVQAIPKTIIQTFSTRRAASEYHWNAHATFAEHNPEYSLLMFTDKECRQFIQSHLPEVLDAYDLLISPTFKADLFRYAYLLVQGGCYFDHKMILRLPLRRVIRANDTLLVCSDAHPGTGLPARSLRETDRLYNAVICSAPNEPRIRDTIDSILSNIAHRHNSGSDLSLTGPIAFYKAIRSQLREEEVRWMHGVRLKSIVTMRRKYEDYYVKDKQTNKIFLTKFYKGFYSDPKHRYGTLWKAQTVYYDLLINGPWKVLAFPGQAACVRAELSSSGAIVLKLLSAQAFYEGPMLCQFIRVVVLNDATSEEYRVEIPSLEVDGASRYALQLPFMQPL